MMFDYFAAEYLVGLLFRIRGPFSGIRSQLMQQLEQTQSVTPKQRHLHCADQFLLSRLRRLGAVRQGAQS